MLLKKTFGIACLSLFTSMLCAQTSGVTKTFPATPLPGGTLADPSPMMPLIVPLFVEGDQFSSTLTLVNNSTATTYADITLRGLDGKSIASRRVNFTPYSQRRVEIGKLLDANGSSAMTGSIVVMQSKDLAGPSIAAVLSMTYSGSVDPNYIDEEIFMPSMKGSQVLQGVADRANGSPILAISSMDESVQHVQIQCFGKDGTGTARRIELAAGETLVTDACVGSALHGNEFTTALEQMDESVHGPQGIRLISDAMPGSFAAFALARHKEHGDRYFSGVLFTDPKSLNSPNTVFTGVPVGQSALLPEGHYIPELTLTNFSTKEVHVHTTFARTAEGTSAAQEVASIAVPSHSTRELVLHDLNGDPRLQNSFVVHSDGAPGDLVAKFVSRGDSRLHEVELQAKDEADMENAGAHPWSTENSTESTLLLFNHSNAAQTFTVTVSAGGVDWQKEYKLASMQTKAISIRELVEEQAKDDKGNALPKDAKSGEAGWLVTDMAKGSGRLLQSDRSIAMARNFSCGYSGLLCGSQIVFQTVVYADQSVGLFAALTGLTCTSGLPNACSGQRTGSANFNTSWVSLSPSKVSVYGSSTSPSVQLQGISTGTSQVNGLMRSQYCESGGGGSANDCDFTVGPVGITAGTCSGTGKITQTFTANITPSSAACPRNPDSTTCGASAEDGTIDNVSNPSCTDVPASLVPTSTVTYFAGPGTSGKHIGDLNVRFTLRLGATTVDHTDKIPVACP